MEISSSTGGAWDVEEEVATRDRAWQADPARDRTLGSPLALA